MALPRRRLLLAGSALFALSACAYASAETGAVEEALGLLEERYNAKAGVYGLNLSTGRALNWRADDLFATCSAFKAYVAAQILRKDQLGEVRLTDPIYIDPAVYIPVASPITEPHLGGRLPLSELCAAAVRQSDNTATNLMVRLLGGPPSVTEFARSVGDDRTWMVRWELELNSAYPGDPRDTTSPRGMGTGFSNMLTGKGTWVFDEPHRALLEQWMRTIVTGDKRIRAGLPPGWTIADKTGAGDYASTNDIGVAFGPDGERLLLAVMTRTRADDPKAPQLDTLIADVTRVAVPWLLT